MLEELSQRLGYNFKDIKLLEEAVTHPSSSENLNYERLEFLGDAVLSLVITTMLILKFKDEKEGDLAKRRASLINGKVLHKVATSIDIGSALVLSEGEDNSGGRTSAKILENTMEAILGAIYTDGGLSPCQSFIETHWQHLIESDLSPPVDNKTYLQEWAQSKGYELPKYKILEKSGPDHKPLFTIEVKVGDLPSATASASSRKEAEKSAAENMINYIKEHDTKS